MFYSNIENQHQAYNDLEIICLVIDKYQIFKKRTIINLNSKYDVSIDRDDCVVIKKQTDSVNIFPSWLNLKVICGKNGAGKSTILKVLQQQVGHNPNLFIVAKTHNGFITDRRGLNISYNKQTIYMNVPLYDFDSVFFKSFVSYQDPLFHIAELYIERKQEFDSALTRPDYFNNFKIDLYELNDKLNDILHAISRHSHFSNTILNNFVMIATEIINKNPAYIIPLYYSHDTLYENILDQLSRAPYNSPSDLIYAIINNMVGRQNIKKLNKLSNQLFNLMYKSGVTEQDDCTPQVYRLSSNLCQAKKSEIDSIIARIRHMVDTYTTLKHEQYLKNFYTNFFVFTPLSNNISIDDMSTGERQQIFTLANILNQKSQLFIYHDEVEKSLHPEWCRNIINTYVTMLDKLKHQGSKYNLIITTHSPFVLSDIQSKNLICLDNGTVCHQPKSNVFAGNICELLANDFFIKSSIGQYASNIITEIIKKIQKHTATNKDKQIIDSIGDELLKTILQNMYMRSINEQN